MTLSISSSLPLYCFFDFTCTIKPLIIVAGCVAQAESEEMLKREPYIDMVIGPQSYHKINDQILNYFRDLNVDAELVVYKYLGHGFLCYNLRFNFPEINKIVEEVGEVISDLLK